MDDALNQLSTNAGTIAEETAGPLITEPALVFALVMAVILLAPMAMRFLRLPGMIGIILAGALVGENAANLLHRPGAIELLGSVGLLYLMFVAGMSMDLHQFTETKRRSALFGAMSFFIPQLMGIAAGMHLLGYDLATALLLGSIVGSHTLLAYPIAKRLGITKNRAVTMTMGGTIFTDGFALSILAVAVAMVGGELTGMFWLRFAGSVGVFALVIIFGLPILGRLFFRKVSAGGDIDFVFLMVVLFAAAAGSKYVGLAPIVGAFLAGITMNRLVPDTGPLMNRLHFVGDAIFIPFFLLSVGMLIDFRVLVSLEVWKIAAIYTSLVLVGKFIAARIAQYTLSFTSDEGWTMFGLTIPQAAATLAVTLIGFNLGMFDGHTVNAVVIMIFLTCIAGPWLVEHFGRRVALQEDVQAFEPARAPLRILIPLANPASAPALMDVAFMIRRPDSPEPLYPIMVASESLDVHRQIAAGEKMLGYAVTYASGAGVPVSPVTRIDTSIANGITRAIREMRISTVVIGWSGSPSRRRQHLGSVLDQILHDNPQTVLICKFSTPINTTQRVVLILPRLIDREPSFAEAIRTIKLMTSKLGAKLVVVTTEADLPRLQPRLSKVKPQVPTSFETINPWPSLMPRLQSVVHGDDMLVLLSTREGRLAWTPDLSRLPRRLVDQFPSQNLVIFHPAEVTAETAWFSSGPVAAQTPEPTTAEDGTAAAPNESSLLQPSRVLFNLHAREFALSIEQVIASEFQHRAAAMREVRDALIRNASEYSTEVTSGVALLHAHVRHVDQPRFFLATFAEGLEVPRITEPVHLLLILLSPDRLSPEEHLRSLAHIARLMRSTETTDRIRQAKDFSEVMSAVGGV